MRYVIALGGNAIRGNYYEEQLESVNKTLGGLIELISDPKNKVALTHGNGPQVGSILIQNSVAKRLTPKQPMHSCVAQSQGLIGYMIQTSLGNLLRKNNIKRSVSGTITLVEVNPKDPAFRNPTKPIGPFYSGLETRELLCENNADIFKKTENKMWRRVVSSPEPIRILNIDTMKNIFESGDILIACGGGGVPIINDNGILRGVDAVIDKDKASAVLADSLDTDIFIILTNEQKIALNYGKHNEKRLDYMSVEDAKKYLNDGHFAEGSMKPKVEAAIRFVAGNANRKTLVASCLTDIFKNKNGTWIF